VAADIHFTAVRDGAKQRKFPVNIAAGFVV
jgi:hypothetical protein